MVGDRQTRKENGSRCDRILVERTTKGGAPTWSLDNTVPILPSTTPRSSRSLAYCSSSPGSLLIVVRSQC